MIEIESMYTLSVNDLTVARWIAAMVADDATVWADVVQPAGPAPLRATPAP